MMVIVRSTAVVVLWILILAVVNYGGRPMAVKAETSRRAFISGFGVAMKGLSQASANKTGRGKLS
jgi:hypothetical protein